jgi:hypothetical protein
MEFQYPRNWTIENALVTASLTQITIKSPGDSLVIIQATNLGLFPDLQAFASTYPAWKTKP